MKRIGLLTLFLWTSHSILAQAPSFIKDSLDSYIERGLKDRNVPSLGLMDYNNIEYGIFAIRFYVEKSKVKSITTRQNEFVEYDPYTFIKKG